MRPGRGQPLSRRRLHARRLGLVPRPQLAHRHPAGGAAGNLLRPDGGFLCRRPPGPARPGDPPAHRLQDRFGADGSRPAAGARGADSVRRSPPWPQQAGLAATARLPAPSRPALPSRPRRQGHRAGLRHIDDGEAKEARTNARRTAAYAHRCPRFGSRRRPGHERGRPVLPRPARRGGAGRGRARPPRPLRRHPAAHRGAGGRRPVPDGRRAPRRRPPAGLSALHADRPPVHAAAVRRPRGARAPVERGARGAGLRRRVLLRPAAAGVAGAGPDRGVALRRLGAVLVAGHHRRGLHPERAALLRHLRAGAAGRPRPAPGMAPVVRRRRVGGGARQPLAVDGAGHAGSGAGPAAGLAGRAAPAAPAARGRPRGRPPALRVDGLALAPGAARQLLWVHRHLERAVVLRQPGRLRRRRRQPQRGVERPLGVRGVVRGRPRAADHPAGVRPRAVRPPDAGPPRRPRGGRRRRLGRPRPARKQPRADGAARVRLRRVPAGAVPALSVGLLRSGRPLGGGGSGGSGGPPAGVGGGPVARGRGRHASGAAVRSRVRRGGGAGGGRSWSWRRRPRAGGSTTGRAATSRNGTRR